MTINLQEQAANVLERATKLIDGGWCQHASHQDTIVNGQIVDTAYCMVGSVVTAARFSGADYGVEHAAMEAVKAVVPSGSVPLWNDHPDRLHGEVVDKMREAAELARSLA